MVMFIQKFKHLITNYFSKFFENSDVIEIGLLLFGSSVLPIVYIGTTYALLR